MTSLPVPATQTPFPFPDDSTTMCRRRKAIHDAQVRFFVEASDVVDVDEDTLNDILDGFKLQLMQDENDVHKVSSDEEDPHLDDDQDIRIFGGEGTRLSPAMDIYESTKRLVTDVVSCALY